MGQMCCGGFSAPGCTAESFLFKTSKWKGSLAGSDYKDADKKVRNVRRVKSLKLILLVFVRGADGERILG